MIYLDVDGVVADFHLAVDILFGGKFITSSQRNIWERYNISEETFWDKVNTLDFWSSIPLIEGAHTLYKKLAILDEVEFLTLARKHNACVEGKKEWLNRHFPDTKYHITYDKTPYYGKHIILIDDYPKNIIKCGLAGGHGILYPAVDNALIGFLHIDTEITHNYVIAAVKLYIKLNGLKVTND